MKIHALILAAGRGERMTSYRIAKGFIPLCGKEIYLYSTETFSKNKEISDIVLLVPLKFISHVEDKLKEEGIEKIHVISGGNTRQESVHIGLNYLKDNGALDDDLVLIHDAARALVNEEDINNVIKDSKKYGAAVLALPMIDTVLKVDEENISSIPNRSELYEEQTPACFPLGKILKAHDNNNSSVTDDCALYLKKGNVIHITEGSRTNFKITNDIDILFAESIIKNG